MHATVSDTLDVQVLFRTNESLLPEGTQARLQRLAGLLARLDGTLIRIEGHADSRGNQGDNEQLSAQRAAAVALEHFLPPLRFLARGALCAPAVRETPRVVMRYTCAEYTKNTFT